MSNISNFKNTWASYRRKVTEAVAERDRALAPLAGYEGERADAERGAIMASFDEALAAARKQASAGFSDALEAMRGKAEAVGEVMEAPTPEQLRLLQTLSLRESITVAEAQSAARALGGNDAALATLQELCAARGGARIAAGTKSKRQQAHDALREFEDAAKACLAWQGGTRAELMTLRNRQQFEGVPEPERVPIGAAIAADIDAGGMTAAEFTSAIVGLTATAEGAALID